MKAIVILPTYNEKDNILPLIDSLEHHFKKVKNWNFSILVVDDNSPDGTGLLVAKAKKKMTNLYLLLGQKKGLGNAYVRGIDYAIKTLKPDVVFQMDADFSHDPAEIVNFIREVDQGFDVVIGSRYVKGASLPKEWGFYRKLNSFVASWFFGRQIAGLSQVNDVTSGFRAIRVKGLLDRLDLSRIPSQGYSFQLTFLAGLVRLRAKIKEIPIQFAERKAGQSKIGLNRTYVRDVWEFMINALILGIHKRAELVKFLIVGTIGWLVNAISLEILIRYVFFPLTTKSFFFIKSMGLFTSTLGSIELSIISNFVFHENWTFKDRPKKGGWLTRFLKFNLTSVGSPLIQLASVNILTPYFGIHRQVALALGIVVGLLWNWFWNTLWVWKKKS